MELSPLSPDAAGVRLTRRTPPPFDLDTFLSSVGAPRAITHYERGDVIFTQGDASTQLFYIQTGGVKLSVLSTSGKEAVIAMLGHGDFFGEGCLAGQPLRTGSASALTASTILRIERTTMVDLLRKQPSMSDRFLSHMLARNIRIEEDLVDQLFNSSEKRLARALLLMAHYGEQPSSLHVVPRVSQETLAEMIGTTRSRVNFFLNKFKKLGYINYDDEKPLTVHSSLLTILLRE